MAGTEIKIPTFDLIVIIGYLLGILALGITVSQ